MSRIALTFILVTLCVGCTKSGKAQNEQAQTDEKEDWICVSTINDENWACSKIDEKLIVIGAE